MFVRVVLWRISVDGGMTLGPDYGYFINVSKCWLLLKDSVSTDVNIFDGTGVNVCTDGRRYLGSAIGSSDFVNNYVSAQVQSLLTDISLMLSSHCIFMVLLANGHFCVELLLPFHNSLNCWTIS